MPSDSGSYPPPKPATGKPPKAKVSDETPVTLKINFEDTVRRCKLSLRDMQPAILELKVREFLQVPSEDELLLERYSDSAGAYITLDESSQAVYKQLYRAAKAKLKLKLRVTKKSPLLQSKTGEMPVTVQDAEETVSPQTESSVQMAQESSVAEPEPKDETEQSTPARLANVFDILKDAAPVESTSQATSTALPATDTGLDFETSLLTSLMNRHNLDGDVFGSNRFWDESKPVCGADIETISGMHARDDWFTQAASEKLLPTTTRRVAPGILSYAVCCNSCDNNIPGVHYHCSTCDDGDFDLCQECVDEGITCHGDTHWLIKRNLVGGQIITSTTETIAPKPKKKAAKEEDKPEEKSFSIPSLLEKDEPSPYPFSSSYRTCNSCVNDLPETNFLHCTVCEDFDLCHACFSKDAHGHTPKHAFLPAVAGSYVPNHIKIRLAPGRNQMHQAICDGCDKYITGVRHKCLDCPDWDYCSECVLNARFVHVGHRFAPIYEPLDEVRNNRSSVRQTHYGICCDGPLCKSPDYIQGIRYKCTICHDTDFCANCEASPANTHNKTHPLIKFRTPVRHCTVATHAERGDGHQLPQMGDRSKPATSTRSPDQTSIASVQTVVDMKPIDSPIVEEVVKSEPVAEKEAVPALAPVVSQPVPEAKLTEKDLVAVFTRDTIADGTIMAPNCTFEQTWYLRNDGEVAWPAGCTVKFVGGDYMGHVDPSQPAGISELISTRESTTCYGLLPPGEEFPFTVLLRTPPREGKFISYWRLTTKDGLKFGHRLWCDVKVQAPPPPVVVSAEAPRSEETANEAAATRESQMIFPKLEKESPVASVHQDHQVPDNKDARSETTSAPALHSEVEDFDDCGDAEWDVSEDDGFLTDEEYDILDASDEEFMLEQEQQKRQLKK